MESLPLADHSNTSDTSLDNPLGVTKPDVEAVLPFDVNYAKILDSGATQVLVSFKERNYKVHMASELRQTYNDSPSAISIQELDQA